MNESRLRIALLSVLSVVCILYLREAMGFRQLAAWAPLFAGSTALMLLGISLFRDIRRNRRILLGDSVKVARTIEFVDGDTITAETVRAMWIYLGWVLALVGLVAAIGLRIAGPLFIALFLKFDARLPTRFVALATAGTVVALWFFGDFVGFVWPKSLLFGGY